MKRRAIFLGGKVVIRNLILALAVSLPGCVSIPTHEKGMLEAYHRGEQDLATRYILSIKNGATANDVILDLEETFGSSRD